MQFKLWYSLLGIIYYCYYRYFVEKRSVWEEEGEKEQKKNSSISVGKFSNTVDASIAQYTGGYILVVISLN